MKDTQIAIRGKKPLAGRVSISGAKNAALPDLAAVVLSAGSFHFQNLPMVEDIKVMVRALIQMGAVGELTGNALTIELSKPKYDTVPRDIGETSRASILLLGPLLARNGYANVSLPGGCPIGDRHINFHLEGLGRMGADIRVEDGNIVAKADRMSGIDYSFPQKTVTGTENLLMAACLAEGVTNLRNCAAEPEIGDLIDLLKNMGADIQSGEMADEWIIEGKSSLHGASHTVIPDRIELGTYIIAACFDGNDILIENSVPEYVGSLIEILRRMGYQIAVDRDTIAIRPGNNPKAVDVETMPHPGFPTDLQAQLTTLLTQVQGVSRVKENIFNNRFQHVAELNRLGAEIGVRDNVATVAGKTSLKGCIISATDLRASAALVLGGLIAEGETRIQNASQLFRGYERMPQKLKELGADIEVLR